MIEDASLLMLGNLALEKSLITSEQLNSALEEQKIAPALLGEIFLKRKLITRNQLKVLLDIHNLKIFYYDSIKFGFLVIINKLATDDNIRNALELQKKSPNKILIGEILIREGMITVEQRDAILKSQKRLTTKQEDQDQTFVKCPFCAQSYGIVDPDRYRKVRCRHCHLVFEIGIVKHEIVDPLEFHPSNITEQPELTPPTIREKSPLKEKESNDLQRLSSFLLNHNINSGISLNKSNAVTPKIANRKYVFGNEIARGGMGAIVETLDTDIKREVVTKILLRNDSKEAIIKFIEEAQITGQLEHPNIVPVYDLGVNDDGLAYFTMKRVRGETLLRIIEKLRKKDPVYLVKYPLDVLIEIILKVCDGVAFAHEKGVLHRDLKPENIMVGEFGEVLTMDWGLAKVMGREQATEKIENLEVALKTIRNTKGKSKTLEGTIAGTPEYMSPEQAKGHIDQLTYRSDIYSLGAVLFTILAQRLPIEGANPKETLKKVIDGHLNEIPEDVPPELTAIVFKAMEYEPEDRYQTVQEFKEDLINYLRGFSVSAKEDTFVEVAVKFARRNLFLSVGAFSLLIVMFVSIVVVLIMAKRNADGRDKNQETEKRLNDEQMGRTSERQKLAPGLLDTAVQLIRDKKYALAEDKIKTILSYSPDLPDTYYFKGILEYNKENYAEAFLNFKAYEDKIIYGIHPQYPAVHVNGIMKNLYRIREIGLNTVDFYEIKLFFINNKLPFLAEVTDIKISQLFTKYENIVYEISPDLELKLKEGGAILSLENFKLDKKLNSLISIPITEINLESSNIKDIRFLNKMFLKRIILNGCHLDNYHQLSSFYNLEWVELADSNFKETEILKDLKLKGLNLANSYVEDLSPIEGLPLINLDITGLPIKDITSLSKMPLTTLRMGNTRTWSLEPLKGKKLEWLSIWQTGISSLSIIKGQPILHLDIENTLITDLSDLIGSKVERLYLDGECVNDKNIAVINNLKLKVLSIKGFKEQNLKNIINNIPFVKISSGVLTDFNRHYFKDIIELDLSHCSKLQNIKGVGTLLSLEKVSLPGGIKNYTILNTLPKLKLIVTPEYGSQSAVTFFQLIKVP